MVFVTKEGLFGPFCSQKRRRKSWDDSWDESWSSSNINEPWDSDSWGSDDWGSDDWGSDTWGSDNWGSDWSNDDYGDNEIDAIFTSNTATGIKFSFDFNFEFDMVADFYDYSASQVATSAEPARTSQTVPTQPPVITQSSSSTTKQTTTQKTTQATTSKKPTTNPVTQPPKVTTAVQRK